jgi:CHAD domain-containing protein
MSFRFEQNEDVGEGVKRIAREEVEKAIAHIDDEELGPHETVHEVRKRCKKIRGLIRLIRPAFEDTYKSENKRFRDAARTLSEIRDATTFIESLDALARRFPDDASQEDVLPLRARLIERRERLASYRVVGEHLEQFRFSMKDAESRIGDWSLDGGPVSALGSGFKRTYRRARKAMRAARAEPTTEAFHEWRKRVKHHRYHNALLRDIWPAVFKERRKAVKELTDLIGDDHDLAVLRRRLLDEPELLENQEKRNAVLELVNARQRELRVWGLLAGQRLFTDKPKDWKRRVETLWGSWKEEKELVHALGEPSRRVYSQTAAP